MADPAPQPDPSPGAVEIAPGVRVAASLLTFSAVRASGPGGQNVNRRATKVELRVPVDRLPLSGPALARLRRAAGSRLTDAGELIIASDEKRTQLANRRACLDRLRAMLIHAMAAPKQRIPTKPTRGSKERRLEAKRQRGDVKKRRRPPSY